MTDASQSEQTPETSETLQYDPTLERVTSEEEAAAREMFPDTGRNRRDAERIARRQGQ